MFFMTVDQKAQVANAREEQQMSNENDEQNSAEVACPRCDGCGQLADSDDREPWSVWMALPVGNALAVTMGLVKPEPCDECGGTGKAITQPAAGTATARTGAPATTDLPPAPQAVSKRLPAGEHHTGTLDLTGEGNAPANPIPPAAVTALATSLAWSASWDTYSEETQQVLIACALPQALTALEAAYPAIRQQVAEEIATAIEEAAASIYFGDRYALHEAVDVARQIGRS